MLVGVAHRCASAGRQFMNLTTDHKRILCACFIAIVASGATQWLLPPAAETTVSLPSKIATLSVQEALGIGPRVQIAGDGVSGSINLIGARFDDLVLRRHFEKPGGTDGPVRLLSPEGSIDPTWAEFTWLAPNGTPSDVPGTLSEWIADGPLLSPSHPVALHTTVGTTVFRMDVSVDENYMLTVHQSATNRAQQAINLRPLSRLHREDVAGKALPSDGRTMDAVLQGDYTSVDYERAKGITGSTFDGVMHGGWAGFNDHYWLAALIAAAEHPAVTAMTHSNHDSRDVYDISLLTQADPILPGAESTMDTKLFAGAKEIDLLGAYDAKGQGDISRSLGFGYLRRMVLPMFHALVWLDSILGDLGIAILAITVIIRIIIHPLTTRATKSSAKMSQVMRRVQKLRKTHEDDKATMQAEIVTLFKRERINPITGYLPIVLQIPVFIALFKVLSTAVELRRPGFFGLIPDLSATDPTNMFNLLGLLPFDPQAIAPFLHFGILPILMGVSMAILQRTSPPPPNPVMRRLVRAIPMIIPLTMVGFPSGLLIYWTWGNLLSALQQWRANRSKLFAEAPTKS